MKLFFNRNKAAKNTHRTAPAEKSLASNKINSKKRARFFQGFDAPYYLSQNPDVAASNMDILEHYEKYGWRENRRPNNWFDPVDYVQRNPDLKGSATNPFLHFLACQENVELDNPKHTLSNDSVMYWADRYMEDEHGRRPVIIASNMPSKEDIQIVGAHFDANYYAEKNPEVMKRATDPLLHFMTLGWIEMRDPNPNFSVSYYLRNNKDVHLKSLNPYLHYLKHGMRERRASATVEDVKILDLFENDAEMCAQVAKAKLLEPMVAQPVTPRRITSPLKWTLPAAGAVERLRAKVGGKTYRYVVAVPHVRMSGASRVASIFANALAQVRDPSEILVITTDSSEKEYIDWFSDKLDVLDVSKEIANLGPEQKIRALIDVMRGVACQTIINVNSRLMWEAIDLFGRQLHHEFKIVTYLFTSDENIKGDRVGYPIQWMRKTADYHHLLLTDTKALANDISDRLGFNLLPEGAQVVPLYTPISDKVTITSRKARRNEGGHFLWAGRFDPQKRVDILIAIARANPGMTFDVYGKAVLGKTEFGEYDPPENINFKGTYSDLQDVLNTPYTGFLYTAQWDGLPTILLDMATAGLPIVAPNVGGIAELLDNTTGWLIDDFRDVDGYSAALTEMASNPERAEVRARSLQTRIADQFAPEDYINSIKKMVTTYEL
ncbi:glycosyltransferase family 4 protein [Falsihalocynthiibacter sp. BN13B15]|uniref:glycosyltransferase family 4 protein n=1 Tax=Falsihalocynthiibacter sp. BN13B15 TaxID=3240871 RepID=UPI00350EF4BA